jgi:hypothetical protein
MAVNSSQLEWWKCGTMDKPSEPDKARDTSFGPGTERRGGLYPAQALYYDRTLADEVFSVS